MRAHFLLTAGIFFCLLGHGIAVAEESISNAAEQSPAERSATERGAAEQDAVANPADDSEATQSSDAAEAARLHRELRGAWLLVGPLDEDGNPDPNAKPAPGARMKFWGDGHWCITESDLETGEGIFHHGGTYALNGAMLTESLTYATEATESMIGSTFTFRITVDGDTYTQTGIGNPFSEQWQRATMQPDDKQAADGKQAADDE